MKLTEVKKRKPHPDESIRKYGLSVQHSECFQMQNAWMQKQNLCETYKVQHVHLCLKKVRMLHGIPSPPPSVKRLMEISQKFQVKWLQKDKSTFAICFVFGVVFYWMIPVDLSRYTLNL